MLLLRLIFDKQYVAFISTTEATQDAIPIIEYGDEINNAIVKNASTLGVAAERPLCIKHNAELPMLKVQRV